MGAATRREGRERGDRALYRSARAAGYVARETPGGQYWVEAHGKGKLMDWQTATMTAVAYHQLHELTARLALSKITLAPEQVAALRDTFIERTTKTGWGAGEARREMLADVKRWVGLPTIHQAAATKAKRVVSSSEYHAAGVRQQQKAKVSGDVYGSRPGSQAEAYKRLIMANVMRKTLTGQDELTDAQIHAYVVSELGAKAGPLSYVGWYRNWLTKRGHKPPPRF